MFSYGKDNLKIVCKTGKELGLVTFIFFSASFVVTLISYLAFIVTDSRALINFIDLGLTGIKISLVTGFLILFLMTSSLIVMERFRSTRDS